MRNLLTENIILKLFSGLLALILWLYVINTEVQNKVRTISKKLEIKDLDNSKYIAEFDKNVKILIKYKGDRKIIVNKNVKNNINAYISFQGITEGKHDVQVKVSFSEGIEFISIYPSKIPVVLYPVYEKVLPIKYFKGIIKDGYYLKEIKIKPEKVVIRGKKEHVKKAVRAIVHVNMDTKNNVNIKKEEILILTNKTEIIKGIKIIPSKAIVKVKVAQYPIVKKEVRSIVIGNVEKGYQIKSIDIKPKIINIKGNPEIVNKIKFIYTEKFSVEGLKTGIKQSIPIVLPNKKISLVGEDKVTITIKIEKNN